MRKLGLNADQVYKNAAGRGERRYEAPRRSSNARRRTA
ncbi:hypothetical protein [Enterobacter hormaechei]|nr:hypothetical protein [Enterobacter hormaechei]